MNQTLRNDDTPWLRFYEPGVPESVDYKRPLSHGFLEANTRANPHHTPLIFQGFRMGHGNLNQAADALAAYLQARGKQIKAFVVTEPDSTVTQEALIQFCGNHLAKYKWPTQIEFIKELPKTNVGKVLRKDLRAREIAKLEANQ